MTMKKLGPVRAVSWTTTVYLFAAVLLLTAVSPSSAPAAKRTHFQYRVTKATHNSKATGYDASRPAEAHSSSRWKLAKPARKAKNRIGVDYTPVGVVGGGMFNLKGTYSADATATRGDRSYHCSLVAPTGSTAYPLVAPDADQLSVLGGRKGLTVAIGTIGGGAHMATAPFGGGYFQSECLNAWHVNTKATARAATKTVAYKTFRRKKIKLRFKGGYSSKDTTASWTTTIILKRIDPKRKKVAKRKGKSPKRKAGSR